MTSYKGFEIDKRFNIYKDGKQVFTAYYQKCFNMTDCEIQIDASIMAKELQKTALSRMPNLNQEDVAEMLENGVEESEQSMIWCNQKAENELYKIENNY